MPQETEEQITETQGQEQQAPKYPLSAENDPNLALQKLISSRKEKKKDEKKDEKQDGSEAESKKEDEKSGKDVGNAIANALGFRKSKKSDEKKKEEGGESGKEEQSKADAASKDDSDSKKEDDDKASIKKNQSETIVTKKKAQKDIDIAKVVAETAAAVVKETTKSGKQAETKKDSAEFPPELVGEDDKREYEVALFLAEANPKYKNAPKIIADNARKAKSYADKWESANPGKVFDPNDEEHNDFYAGIQPPWTESEFIDARIEMGIRKAEEARKKTEEPVQKKREEEHAIESLVPEVEKATITIAGTLAKSVGDDVFNAIQKDGFESLQNSDPIVAEVLASTVNTVAPLVATIIQMDDPNGRIRFNPKNELHMSWKSFLEEKEEQLEGKKDQHGRTLVSRKEYIEMADWKRKKHWFLSRDHLLMELAKDASDIAKTEIASEKDAWQKRIEKMGYIKKDSSVDVKEKTDSSKSGESKPEKTKETQGKPSSPSVGSGAKIDSKGDSKPTGYNGVLEATHGILFRR